MVDLHLSSALRKRWLVGLGLAVLAVLPYLRAFTLPFISDDYLVIGLARKWGVPSGWDELFADALYRCRATSLILTAAVERLFGLHAAMFTATNVALHVVNVWMVALFGLWKPIGWGVSIPAAGFFALHEIHQEAVIWYSSQPELLVFFFVVTGLLVAVTGELSAPRYTAVLACYVLALLSKESAVVMAPLLALALWRNGTEWRKAVIWATPLALIAMVYAFLIFQESSTHLHLNDGSFSFRAPVWLVWPVSFARLFWFWGAAALAAIWYWKPEGWPGLLRVSLGWIAVTLIPYCFLTYMPRIPSRHTYLASAGVALVVGLAWRTLPARLLPTTAAALIIAHNTVYIWTWKHQQFVKRAEPTEALLRLAKEAEPPYTVTCFPYSEEVAQHTLEVGARIQHPQVQVVRQESAAKSRAVCLSQGQ